MNAIIIVLALLLLVVTGSVTYLIWRFIFQQAKGPLARLRKYEVRRDFFWLMLASGLFIAGAAHLLAASL